MGSETERVEHMKANADVVPTPRRGARLPKAGPRTKIALSVLCALFVLCGAGAAYAAYDHAKEFDGRLLPGMVIAGVDVGGMDEAEALAAVEDAIRPELDRTLELRWEDRSWGTTPRELGARDNSEHAVAQALAASEAASFLDRVRMKVFGSLFDFSNDIAIAFDRKQIRGFVGGIASGFDREARDATVDYSSGWIEIVPDRTGRKVVKKRARLEVMAALEDDLPIVELPVKILKPKATTKDFEQVLLVRIGENKLYLYEDGEITESWTVATGLPEYPTPTGLYEVTELRYLPTWVNPAPDTWGKDMPAEIPPGPGNPLGLRAINWSAPAIRFHGTSAIYSLGYNASHGCVRMANEDVIELYDMIEVGVPIVSTVVAPLRPLYASAPDPTLVPEDTGDESPSTDPDERTGARKEGNNRERG